MTAPAAMPALTSPYARVAHALIRNGWSPIPLRPFTKMPPPEGRTGRAALPVDADDATAYINKGMPRKRGLEPVGNVAVALRPGVVGIDVDTYDGKRGAETMRALTAKLGKLPRTVVSSRRFDTHPSSGIRFFRVPPGTELVGNLEDLGGGTKDVEVIQPHHRYAVVAPSVVGDQTYALRDQRDPSLGDFVVLPPVDFLPWLPQAWIDHLTVAAPAAVTDPDAGPIRLTGGEPSPLVLQKKSAALETIRTGSRHDTVLKAVMALARLAEQEEPGVLGAVDEVRRAFVRSVTADGSRRRGEAEGEFDRMLPGALKKVAQTPTPQVAWDPEAEASRSVPAGASAVGVVEQEPVDPPAGTSPAPLEPGPTALLAGAGPDGEDDPDGFDFTPAVPAADIVKPAEFVVESDPDDDPGVGPSTWAPLDTASLLGTYTPPKPELWRWTDGDRSGHLLYRGKVHAIFGQPGTWKSFAGEHAVADVVLDGGTACVIDAEEDARVAMSRLMQMGLTREQVIEKVTFISPDGDFRSEENHEAYQALLASSFDIVLIDSFAATSTLSGVRENVNDDVTLWMTQVPLRIARRTNAAVVLIDHVAKPTSDAGAAGADRYAIGAQAKLARAQVNFRMGVSPNPPTKYHENRPGSGKGEAFMVITKERFGEIGGEGTRVVLAVDSTGDIDPETGERPVKVDVRVPWEVPKTEEEKREQAATAYRARILEVMRTLEKPESARNLRALIGGKTEKVSDELVRMAHDGYVENIGTASAHAWQLTSSWREKAKAAGLEVADPEPDVTFNPEAELLAETP